MLRISKFKQSMFQPCIYTSEEEVRMTIYIALLRGINVSGHIRSRWPN